MGSKTGDKIKAGDVIVFLGTPHLIERIDPPSAKQAEWGIIGNARAGDGWGIALDTLTPFEVAGA